LVPPDVTTPRDRGELLAEISRSLVLLHTGERTLRDAGRGEAVEDQRGALQDVLRHRFRGDEREAMQAWAEQTRHQARLLREEGREPSDAT
jgi:hypothetical protein